MSVDPSKYKRKNANIIRLRSDVSEVETVVPKRSKRTKRSGDTDVPLNNKFDALSSNSAGRATNSRDKSNSKKPDPPSKSITNPIVANQNDIINLGASTSTAPADSMDVCNDVDKANDNTVLGKKPVRQNNFTVPPVMLSAIKNYAAHIRAINQKLNKKLICRPANGGEIIRIHPETTDEYRQIVHYFDENELQYYVLPHKNTKPYKVVIRGLALTTECEEVKTELSELGYDVLRISQMYSRKNDRVLPLFQAHIRRIGDFEEILNTDYLLCMSVEIEEYRSTGAVAQCFNCQRFHHSSEICNMKPRCLKCAGEHKAQDCPLGKRVNSDQLVCANCLGNHPANFSKCVKNPRNSVRKTGVSYAEITRQPGSGEDARAPKQSTGMGKDDQQISKEKEGQTSGQAAKPIGYCPPPSREKRSTPPNGANKQATFVDFVSDLVTKIIGKIDFNNILGKFMKVLPEILAAESTVDKIYVFISFIKSIFV